MLPTNHLHVVPPILSEAVLATKETNERTRQAGFDLIIEMGNKMRAGGTINRALIPGMQDGMDNESEQFVLFGLYAVLTPYIAPANVSEYFTMVAAGLTSTPHMISACITALSRLLFDFHKDIDVTTTDELLSTISVFLKSNTREIVKSSLGFVKVCIAVLPHTTVETFLPNLVPSLLGWGNDHKNHFNLKVRHIFERLIRKFGFDKVASLVPEDGKKLVQNIRKKQLRAKRKKTDQLEDNADDPEQTDMAKPKTTAKNAYEEAVYGSEDEAGDDSDDDPMAPSQSKQRGGGKAGRGKSAHKTAAAYLQEDGDMPMDLLDQEQLDRVTSKSFSNDGGGLR